MPPTCGACYNSPSDTWRSAITVIPDNPNWRRHKGACPFYREHWCVGESLPDGEGDGSLLYQIICLQGTPPMTAEEQQRCMRSRHRCWRLGATEHQAPIGARSPRDPRP
ncbi:MAG TPA: hypothetical protein VIN09_09180 [Chloroflexota bacterium]